MEYSSRNAKLFMSLVEVINELMDKFGEKDNLNIDLELDYEKITVTGFKVELGVREFFYKDSDKNEYSLYNLFELNDTERLFDLIIGIISDEEGDVELSGGKIEDIIGPMVKEYYDLKKEITSEISSSIFYINDLIYLLEQKKNG